MRLFLSHPNAYQRASTTEEALKPGEQNVSVSRYQSDSVLDLLSASTL